MQVATAALQAILDSQERDLVDVVEIYASSYVPGVNGFDPASAEECFSSVEGLTFVGEAYRRLLVDRGDVQKFMGRQANTCSCRFSNIDRYMANWINGTSVEGKWLVCRVISLSASTILADSIVIFAGRIDKPGDVDDREVTLTAREQLGSLNQKFPARSYGPNDPLSRDPADPLFEGFRFTPILGSNTFVTRVVDPGFGMLLNRGRHVSTTYQFSSKSAVGADRAVAEIFGRCQILLFPMAWIDIGGAVNMLQSAGEGEIAGWANVRSVNPQFTIMAYNVTYGKLGGVDEQIPDPNPNDRWPGDGYYSRTAFARIWVNGSDPTIDETEAPQISAVIKGKKILTPDSSGVYNTTAWSNNPVDIARYLIADSRHLNEGDSAMDDVENVKTRNFCLEPILDTTQGERYFVTDTDLPQAEILVRRFPSTGLINTGRILGADPALTEVPASEFEGFDPFVPIPVIADVNRLRERYTCNVVINDWVTAVDFLYNVIFASFRGYVRRNGKGKIQILSERPSDNTRLRAASAVGATTLKVQDVTPWKLSTGQWLHTGTGLTTSENRRVSSADYTADANAITIAKAVTGGVTATLSGATFAGGSAAVQASATVTIAGTMTGSVQLTINGLSVTYSLNADDTTTSVAAMLGYLVNATPALRQFIAATWVGAVLTLKAKWGLLTLSSALANAHAGPVAPPTSVPSLGAAAAGSLPAGTYHVAFSYVTAEGETAIGPSASVTVTAGQRINAVPVAGPAGVTAIRLHMSRYAGSTEMRLHSEVPNAGIVNAMTTLPANGARLPPLMNTTGEEVLRVAMPFSSNNQTAAILAQSGLTRGNIHDNTFKWPMPARQSSTNQIAGAFIDATDDFARTPLEVNDYDHQAQIRKVNKLELDLAGVDNYNQAFRLCNAAISKYREGDFFNEIKTNAAAILLEEGDLVTASSDNGGFVNLVTRVESLTIGPASTPGGIPVTIVGRKYSTLMFTDEAAQHTITLPTTLKYVQTLDALVEFVDLPAIREEDVEVAGFYVLASYDETLNGDYRGAALYPDYGDGYVKLIDLPTIATIGTATTTLASASAEFWDRTNSLTVTLHNTKGGPPTSLTEAQILANARANLAVIGNEYIQFKTVVDNGSGSYTFSTLLRGRFGTEHNTTHGASERFALMEGATFVPIETSKLNAAYNYKAVTTNQDVADASPVSFTWTGGTLKPWPPTQPHGIRDGQAGSLLMEFTRRSRKGLGLRPTVPVNEEEEAYEIDVFSNSARTTILDTFRWRGGTPKPAMWAEVPVTGLTSVAIGPYGEHLITLNTTFQKGVLQSRNVIISEGMFEFTVELYLPRTLGLIAAGRTYIQPETLPYYFDATGIVDATTVWTVRPEGDAGSATTVVAGDRLAIVLSEGRAYYYKNFTSLKAKPLYVSPRIVDESDKFTAVSEAQWDGVNNYQLLVRDAKFTDGRPGAYYPDARQTEVFGSVQSTVYANVHQMSKLVGRGAPLIATF